MVDTDRCQIRRDDETVSLEPKVMDILFYLAKHPAQVVSQQELFLAIWPDAIYNPSSIQRCIALLRKALKEDARNPKAIITHPKRGYSLELPVEFQFNDKSSTNRTSLSQVSSNQSSIKHAGNDKDWTNKLVSLSIFASFMLVAYLLIDVSAERTIKEQYTKLTPVVSSGQNEYSSQYSPDGKYLAYIAQFAEKRQHVWVKELETGKLNRLSANAANFVSINWNHDQQAIGFVKRLDKADQVGRLPFNRFQLDPVAEQILLTLKDEFIISQLQWTKNGDFIFITKDLKQHSRLFSYSMDLKRKNILLAEEVGVELLDLALSNDNKTLALINNGKQNRYPILLLDLASLKLRPLVVLHGSINGLNWHPGDKRLLVSHRKTLLLIDLSGETKDLNFTNYLGIENANFSPDGREITMTLVGTDIDIVGTAPGEGMSKSIINSNSIDIQPLFSPDSSRFAFVSLRSGSMQVFVYQDAEERLLLKNDENKEFFGMAWSPDSRQLAVSMEDILYIIDTKNGDIKRKIEQGFSSIYLRDWYNHENALLVNLPGPVAAKYDLDSMLFSQISEQSSHCAALDLNDNVYFNQTSKILKVTASGMESIFWQPTDSEISNLVVSDDGLIVELEKQQDRQLLKIKFDRSTPMKTLASKAGNNWLADASADGSQILYMTRSHINKTIVTLQ